MAGAISVRTPRVGKLVSGQLRKPSPRLGPSLHVEEARKLHSTLTPRMCENVPIRLYTG